MGRAAQSGRIARQVLAYVQRPTVLPTDPRAVPPSRPGLSGVTGDFAVAATPRFRASQRRPLLDAARHGMVIVLGAALVGCVWLAPFHPDAFALLIGLNAAMALIAGVGYVGLTKRARRHPEMVVFVVVVAVDVATITLGLTDPSLSLVTAGYLLLMPTIVALVIPWQTRVHVGWLILHVAATLAYGELATGGGLAGGRDEKIALVIIAVSISQLGHVIALRARVLSFVQIERIRALNRQARRDHARLDRLNDILEQSARTDELTGLKNRSSMQRDLRAIRGRITRHREVYGLLVLDLDRFKAINDSLGHVAGDRVLREVAGLLMNAVRADDSVYRYGGEEFVVLLEVTDPNEALMAAERIRQTVEEVHLPNPGNPPYDRVTLSVGVAAIGPDDLAADDDAWFGRADAALYRAKAGGRNRCESEIPPSRS